MMELGYATMTNLPSKPSRRKVLTTGAIGGASLALAPLVQAIPNHSAKENRNVPTSAAGASAKLIDEPTPSIEAIALNRMAFGPRPGDLERVAKMGFENYVHEQLHPDDRDDAELEDRLKEVVLHVEYDLQKNGKTIKKIKEDRHLESPNLSVQELYKLYAQNPDRDINSESYHLVDEIRAIKLTRAVYSKWQLRETLCDFWHNHFSVDVYVDEATLRVMFPQYDREVIRANSLGNFRKMLGMVAKSHPMLVYLNNEWSQASPANENYARELFELHTLGAEHYYNDHYNKWEEVPGATQGHPIGYIDQDVYEAARAFTGWTIADGKYGRNEQLPNTGEFFYYDAWHDPYQKRILGQEFDAYSAPMADGERVLDLVAYHPGTARHICSKLIQRYVAPVPPERLLNAAVKTWTENQKNDLQLAMVMKTILLSPEFKSTWGELMKLPLEATVGLIRASGQHFVATNDLPYILDRSGESLFNWPTPNGRPWEPGHWVSSAGMLTRWFNANLVFTFKQHWLGNGDDLIPTEKMTANEFVTMWSNRILGRPLTQSTHDRVVQMFKDVAKLEPDQQFEPKAIADFLRATMAVIAMTPEYQVR